MKHAQATSRSERADVSQAQGNLSQAFEKVQAAEQQVGTLQQENTLFVVSRNSLQVEVSNLRWQLKVVQQAAAALGQGAPCHGAQDGAAVAFETGTGTGARAHVRSRADVVA